MSPTILVVDDHPSFRASACALLEAEGFHVVGEADDGASALSAARELQPEVVLLDVQLPDISGLEVCRRLLAEDGEHPAVVLVSSRDAVDVGEEAIRASGAQGFLPKSELSGEAVASLVP